MIKSANGSLTTVCLIRISYINLTLQDKYPEKQAKEFYVCFYFLENYYLYIEFERSHHVI